LARSEESDAMSSASRERCRATAGDARLSPSEDDAGGRPSSREEEPSGGAPAGDDSTDVPSEAVAPRREAPVSGARSVSDAAGCADGSPLRFATLGEYREPPRAASREGEPEREAILSLCARCRAGRPSGEPIAGLQAARSTAAICGPQATLGSS
jgi:hypothetical protein